MEGEAKLSGGTPLTVDQLLGYFPALQEMPRAQLENWARGSAVVHKLAPGEVVCEEGEFGSTAFYIVSGKVNIFIRNPMAHLRTRPAAGFIGRSFKRMKSFLVDDADDARPDTSRRQFIGIDANVDLPTHRPLAEMGAGELFGEMTCRTFQPRSATVETSEPSVIVEMLRVVLDMLVGTRQVSDASKAASKVKVPTFKGTSFKTEMEKNYRERSLSNHLRRVPLLAPLTDEFVARLKDQVELVSFNQGQVICREGDEADAFFLVRSGVVRVSESMPGGEIVRTYLSRGDYFGEIALLHAIRRTATCTALDAVDLVKIPATDFHDMVREFPAVQAQVEEMAAARLQASETKAPPAGLQLNEFLDQGLFEAQNLLLIDLDNCTRCDACVQACAQAHDGVSRLLRDGLRYDHYLVATACRSCRDPLCMTQCPVGSIRRKENLEIIIEDWCIGCGKCAELCPYGNINMHPFELLKEVRTEIKAKREGEAPRVKIEQKKTTAYKANTCDLCTELSTPSCVYACPHDAAKRVDPRRFFSDIFDAETEILRPKSGRSARERRHTH